jgi:hypothetical protein
LKEAVVGTVLIISGCRLAIDTVSDNDDELTVTVSKIAGRFIKTRLRSARNDTSKVRYLNKGSRFTFAFVCHKTGSGVDASITKRITCCASVSTVGYIVRNRIISIRADSACI